MPAGCRSPAKEETSNESWTRIEYNIRLGFAGLMRNFNAGDSQASSGRVAIDQGPTSILAAGKLGGNSSKDANKTEEIAVMETELVQICTK